MQTASDVYLQAKRRVGVLAKRGEDPQLALDDVHETMLEVYLKDGLREVAKRTDRLTASLTLSFSSGDAWMERPSHIDVIEEAQALDSGTAYDVSVESGAETARKARAPSPETGRPCEIGHHGGRLWVWPVPDGDYEIQIEAILNGEVPQGAFVNALTQPAPSLNSVSVSGAAVTVSYQPTSRLDLVVAAVPPELERAVVAYVVAEWLSDNAERELAQKPRRRFERDLRKYDTDPMRDTTATRSYNPLSI